VSGGIAQLFLNLGTRRGCVVSITPRPPLPRERPGTHRTGGWVGPGAVLDRCGKSRPTGRYSYIIIILLLLLLLLTAIEMSLGGSSPFARTDKTNKNKYT
jgi:hypothetical protein